MLFSRRTKKSMDIMNERNRDFLEKYKEQETDSAANETELKEAEEKAEEYRKNNDMGLEKGDMPALIISAFLVFGPIFLVLGGLLALAWIFLH